MSEQKNTRVTFKGGRLPVDPSKPRLRFAKFVATAQVAPAPPSSDWVSEVASWPMYGNDTIGDCTFATVGHMEEIWSTYGQRQTRTLAEAAIIGGYSAVSGYDPKTGANDNGAVVQDVLNYWRKTGVGGSTILAFAAVDHNDVEECKQAAAMFGGIYLGINFPASAMDQFNRGEPWTPVTGSRIEGGHAINAAAYDTASGMWKIITWGAVQEMSQAFFDQYVDEAWVIISPDFFDANGQAPSGVDMAALGEQFTALTGEPSPFPSPTPEPVPAPTPAPSPEPTPEPTPTPGVEAELKTGLSRFLKTKSVPSYLRVVAQEWVDAQ